ncbi:MAG: hypothetical protein ABIQ29_07865 [Burkholderiaceae bacterium]
MKLLLDTHCLIWLLSDAAQLDASARKRIADAHERAPPASPVAWPASAPPC